MAEIPGGTKDSLIKAAAEGDAKASDLNKQEPAYLVFTLGVMITFVNYTCPFACLLLMCAVVYTQQVQKLCSEEGVKIDESSPVSVF